MNSHIQRSTLTIKRKDLQTILRFGHLPRNSGPLQIELERISTRHAQSCVTFREQLATGNIFIYMDDILIATKGTWEDHYKEVEKVSRETEHGGSVFIQVLFVGTLRFEAGVQIKGWFTSLCV